MYKRQIEIGAQVKNSILSPKAIIGEGAKIENAIIDKSVEVAPGITIKGTSEEPMVVAKGTKVVEDMIR